MNSLLAFCRCQGRRAEERLPWGPEAEVRVDWQGRPLARDDSVRGEQHGDWEIRTRAQRALRMKGSLGRELGPRSRRLGFESQLFLLFPVS